MAKAKYDKEKVIHETIPKGTSIGRGHLKLNSMNKKKRASFTKYRGQGR